MSRRYFEDLYAREADPWRFETNPYEREKYRVTLKALPKDRYRRALEVGCSIGVLTRQLADRCSCLLAIDVADEPLRAARRRCADASQVHLDRMTAPAEWPDGAFDLILLSEMVYYLNRADVAKLADRVIGSLATGGDLLLVHWTGPTNYPLSGSEAAKLLLKSAHPSLRVVRQERFDKFRLDLARRA
jgi:cyclopropane fatty-acyl-phospholipid synthase-like methyltransferase